MAQSAARWTIQHLDDESDRVPDTICKKGRCNWSTFTCGTDRPATKTSTLPMRARPRPASAISICRWRFFGHTHLQGGFFSKQGRVGAIPAVRKGAKRIDLELEPDMLYMVNPGSVGQPRDGDPRAAYAFYDSEQRPLPCAESEYPVQKTARTKSRQARLPDVLALRLFQGSERAAIGSLYLNQGCRQPNRSAACRPPIFHDALKSFSGRLGARAPGCRTSATASPPSSPRRRELRAVPKSVAGHSGGSDGTSRQNGAPHRESFAPVQNRRELIQNDRLVFLPVDIDPLFAFRDRRQRLIGDADRFQRLRGRMQLAQSAIHQHQTRKRLFLFLQSCDSGG